MEPVLKNKHCRLYHGDCLEVMKTLKDNSVHAVVTDPPYGLSFMGKTWDYDVPSVAIWQQVLRVLKPGGHVLAFAGTRTQHRMAVRIEDAGFEIRDMICWCYGSGYPKSLDVSKAIDKKLGEEREVVGTQTRKNDRDATSLQMGRVSDTFDVTAPASDEAKQWDGWGTALKPSLEPITVARKPLEGTVAENVLEYGVGGINVDGCRVGTEKRENPAFGVDGWRKMEGREDRQGTVSKVVEGRWPANLIHDGSEGVLRLFPCEEGMSAARFFYCAKTSKQDREEGCEHLPPRRMATLQGSDNDKDDIDPVSERFRTEPSRNHHPTVKPTDLMRYLCKLVTPPNGIVLDSFMGSGSTGKAAILEGFRFIGMERDLDSVEIAKARVQFAINTVAQYLF